MAIFTKKDKKIEEKKTKVGIMPQASLSHVLRQPRVTEKASFRMGGNVYTFEVDTKANKKMIARAVTETYKVTPVKVNIARIPKKKITKGGKSGFSGGGKKAYVYLKEGDSIELI